MDFQFFLKIFNPAGVQQSFHTHLHPCCQIRLVQDHKTYTEWYVDGVSDMTFPRLKERTWVHPTKLPATKSAGLQDRPRVVSTTVNNWEPKSVTRLVYIAKTYHRVPIQYRRSTRNNK